ncbi:PEP-CTERM sorting domain-containing protein [bacterium]|nr:MAG: PEP-CTERM sorting domain-containing protein [bacterium]
MRGLLTLGIGLAASAASASIILIQVKGTFTEYTNYTGEMPFRTGDVVEMTWMLDDSVPVRVDSPTEGHLYGPRGFHEKATFPYIDIFYFDPALGYPSQVELQADGPKNDNWAAIFYDVDNLPTGGNPDYASLLTNSARNNIHFAKIFANGTYDYANGTVDSITVTAVPEPASLAALGLGATALIRRRKNA